MSYTTDCAILGNNTIFQVNIDGGQSVLDLKDAIEVEGKKILAHVLLPTSIYITSI